MLLTQVNMTVTIRSEGLAAEINPHGAELWSLRDGDGRELMTDADPAYWTGHAPLLFPVVGKPAGEIIRVDGRVYPMKQHGFARRRTFSLVEQAADRVRFRLQDDGETRAAYPFAFRLDVAYTVSEATLTVEVTVANPGDVPLPASFGFHPAFAWPLPYGAAKEDHRIVFSGDEPDALRRLGEDGGILRNRRPSPLDGRTLHLADSLFTEDALIWDAVRSRSVRYGAPGKPQLDVAFDAPMLGIWTKPGAHFVCIEPWHGIADPEGYRGEYADKPGIFTVVPGGEKRIMMTVTLREGDQ
jgi:galactose mutarotase-like enzyme